jgi:dipeptidyl-peptidase-4
MKNILLSLIIGLFLSSLVAQENEKNFTLDNVIKRNEFRAKGVYGLKSMNDGKHYCTNRDGNILLYSYKSGDLIDTLLKADWLFPDGSDEKITLRSYSFSLD